MFSHHKDNNNNNKSSSSSSKLLAPQHQAMHDADTKAAYYPAEVKNQGDYSLCLLPNNDTQSLAAAHSMINGSNAVLLYPDSKDTSSSSGEARKYKACFIQGGSLRVHPSSKLVEEVSYPLHKVG